MTSWLTLFFASALLLPPLPIALGNSGPHLCLLFAAAGLVFGIASLTHWRVVPCSLNAAFTAFFGVLFASIALAAIHSGAEAAAASFARVALLGISIYVFFFTAYGPAPMFDALRATRRIYVFAALSALFACVDFYYQFPAPAGYGPQFVWLDSGVYRRAQGFFYEASTLGNFCAFFLVMIGAALLAPGRLSPISRRAWLPGGMVFAAALVLSFSRASLLNVLVAAAALLYLRRPRTRLARIALLFGGMAVAGLLLLRALLPEFTDAYWLRLTTSTQYFFSETEGVLSGRVGSWRAVLAFLAEHPWHAILGVGYKTLPYSDYLGRTVITDNMYLSLLAETGIVGLGAMLWLSLEILRAARRAARSADSRRSFFGTWIFAFWAGQMVQMFSGDLLTYWRVMPLYFWVLALAVRDERPVP
jgi:O-antigen ligase